MGGSDHVGHRLGLDFPTIPLADIVLEKLQIHSRMEAVMVAVREKLIELG